MKNLQLRLISDIEEIYQESGIYFIFEKSTSELVYIGTSINLWKRLNFTHHIFIKDAHFVAVMYLPAMPTIKIYQKEQELIYKFKPKMNNKSGNSGSKKSTKITENRKCSYCNKSLNIDVNSKSYRAYCNAACKQAAWRVRQSAAVRSR